jgi:hypothetical protein
MLSVILTKFPHFTFFRCYLHLFCWRPMPIWLNVVVAEEAWTSDLLFPELKVTADVLER